MPERPRRNRFRCFNYCIGGAVLSVTKPAAAEGSADIPSSTGGFAKGRLITGLRRYVLPLQPQLPDIKDVSRANSNGCAL
jgi:hypothetical protein